MDQKNIISLKQLIKSENTRLSSLSIPRDLSLGGTKPKKVYVPNLNVVRNKTKSSPAAVKAQHTQRKRLSQKKHDDTKNPRFVQSSGVFSEGTYHLKKPTIYSDKHATTREKETSSGMKKPSYGKNFKVNIKEENTVVNDLLGNDDESDSDSCDDNQPLVLPLSNNIGEEFFKKFSTKKDLDQALKVNCTSTSQDTGDKFFKKLTSKKELDQASKVNCSSTSQDMDCGKFIPSFASNLKEFDDDNGPIALIKMPDTLPGKGFDENDKPADYSASQMNEGYVGKILVRKSGKTELIFGKTKYSLDASKEADCTEELISIPGKEEFKKNPDIVTFGQVNEKFVLAPIWPNLIAKKKS